MHPATKILIGALMIVVGVYVSISPFRPEVIDLVQGSIGPLLALIGAFIVWLESDEWKMRREQQTAGLQQEFQAETITSEVEETEEEEETEGHTCPECGSTFDTERGMHIHQAQKHD